MNRPCQLYVQLLEANYRSDLMAVYIIHQTVTDQFGHLTLACRAVLVMACGEKERKNALAPRACQYKDPAAAVRGHIGVETKWLGRIKTRQYSPLAPGAPPLKFPLRITCPWHKPILSSVLKALASTRVLSFAISRRMTSSSPSSFAL